MSSKEVFFEKGSEVDEATPVLVGITVTPPTTEATFEHVKPLTDSVDPSVTEEEKVRLKELLHEYADVFSKSEVDLGCTDLGVHFVDTGEARPIKQKLPRQSLCQVEVIDKRVEEMLQDGIIDISQSPWVSNVVIVKKNDGSARFWVDYY